MGKNGVLRDKESVTTRKELSLQKAITEKLEGENKNLKVQIEKLMKSLSDKDTQMAEHKTKTSSEMERKDREISKVKGELCNMRAQGLRDEEEIACLNTLLKSPSSDESDNSQPPKNQDD